MKYKFIQENRGEVSVGRACEILDVSSAGYYKSLKTGKSKRELENERILELIKIEYKRCRGRIGSPTVTARLRRLGEQVNEKRIERLMRENGIAARIGRKYKRTTDSNHPHPPAPNLLKYVGVPQKRNRAWVTDITFLWTTEGWLYLCIFMDLSTRKIVGWSVGSRITADLVIEAFRRAVVQEKPEPGLIVHSDRGVQYASQAFRSELMERYFQSMSGKGNCYDNAFAESFFHTLKAEWYHQEALQEKSLAKRDLFEYIEVYYNRERIHSSLGNMTPVEKDQRLKEAA